MEQYQKKIKKMSEYGGIRKITATFTDDQMDRVLGAFGGENKSKLIRDLLMKAVREKEVEKVFQKNSHL
jgi:muramoyltetrapeptide carboxypeptidase LdcA involved in peptidoglycan recycling